MMKPNNKTINAVLALLTPLAVFGMISGSNEPVIGFLGGTWLETVLYRLHIGNEIVFNLSVGFLVSLFFWALVVRIPEQRRRSIIKNNLARQYQNFKEDTIRILLAASGGSYDSRLPRKLCDHNEFKKYFTENRRQNWYDVLNGLQSNEGHLNDLLVEIELLANEIAYVLNNIDIDDERVHSFFKNLSTHVYKLKNSTVYTDDHVKYLGNFIWGILARWSFIDGQQEEDIVQVMIEQIGGNWKLGTAMK